MAHELSDQIGNHTLEPVKQYDEEPCPVCGDTHPVAQSYLAKPDDEFRCPSCDEIVGVPGEEKEPAKIARPL
ncbi:hypothetical protein [Haloarcula rubripromontorii]|uniref:hypothetical protein n=1 Tax=Haloarcula rubripromontorii TaxID=1705562 RepID=UPI00345C1E4F